MVSSSGDASQKDDRQREISLGEFDDNLVKPFMLESSNLRGRVVRLGSELNDILSAHDYPKPISHLTAETITLSLLLSSMLKYEGLFTLQTQGDGPVKMLVSDVTSGGDIRGCASFDAERVEMTRNSVAALKSIEASQNHLAQYLGKGYIAFTIDPKSEKDRYQGIVELRGSSLIDCVQYYFKQSEQIGTGIKMAVGQRDGEWRAAGIMLQNMPEEDGEADVTTFQSNADNLDEDAWRRSMILLDSCTEEELLDPDLSPNELLRRLFHEEGVRVFEPKPVQKKCRCTNERVEIIISSMSREDIEFMIKDKKITVKCEFCSKDYVYDPTPFLEKKKSSKPSK